MSVLLGRHCYYSYGGCLDFFFFFFFFCHGFCGSALSWFHGLYWVWLVKMRICWRIDDAVVNCKACNKQSLMSLFFWICRTLNSQQVS